LYELHRLLHRPLRLAWRAFFGAAGVASLGAAPTYSLLAAALLLAIGWQLVASRRTHTS
jgi:hypothetical protein